MRIGSLFSGIGGLELGLERAGLGYTVWQVEKDPFCREVLAQHWPAAERFDDVTKFEGRAADVICGGFPCQDISSAGKGAGLAGSRSGLWFEFSRIIHHVRPRWVVVENVASGARRWVDRVCAELGQLEYETLPVPLSAQDVGAPHVRRRIFVIAHTHSEQLREQQRRGEWASRERSPEPANDGEALADAIGEPSDERRATGEDVQRQAASIRYGVCDSEQDYLCPPWEMQANPEPSVCRVVDGLPRRVDRLRALGNAVVPQCAEVIGRMIVEAERRAQ